MNPFFFNDTATTEIYTLSLHDALPISFAGVAAGGALSSMFWNPATMTQTPGFGLEANGTGILANADQHPLAGSRLLPLGFGGASDWGSPALLLSGYSTWQINPNLW